MLPMSVSMSASVRHCCTIVGIVFCRRTRVLKPVRASKVANFIFGYLLFPGQRACLRSPAHVVGRSCNCSTQTHLSPEKLKNEMLIYEDLSKLGKEGCRFDEGSRGFRHTALVTNALYRLFPGTTRLFFTENTPGTPFARMPAMFLSDWRSTTPSRVTFPRFTIMRIGRFDPTP